MDGLEYCCSLLVLPAVSPFLFLPSFFLCVYVNVCVHVWGHSCECWCMNVSIRVEPRSQSYVSGAIYLVAIILQFLSWPGTHKLGKASWPVTLEDLHFSASPAQKLRVCAAMPGFFRGVWRLSSGPHASVASTWLTAPSAQPFSWAPHTCQPHLHCRWQRRSQWAKLHRCPRASGEDMEVGYRST